MSKSTQAERARPLLVELRRFVNLRWCAAAGILLGALIDRHWLNWYGHTGGMLALGVTVAAYNVLLFVLTHRLAKKRRKHDLLFTASIQILLDLSCLTFLAAWTRGLSSPILGFFVFHMVFASLLLPRLLAFGSAAAAIVLLMAGLAMTRQLPRDPREWLIFTGEAVTLVLSVALASRITKDLRRQRGMLVRRNRRIRGMTKRLRHQQRAMVQHEKMVAVGQMAAGVAHEIANPLASMDSLLQLLQRKPEKLGPDKLVTLREQVERIHQIIQQMKVFAHPNEGNWQTVPLNDLVEQAINMVRFDLRLKTLQVVREFTPDAGSITVLPQAIHQVLVNLIINALDAMADVEQPRLTVRTARREGWCAIKVEDNGSGIQPEHMNRLFEPFFTTKPVGRGTGLGLSISYSLIRKQGGKIEVNSEVGRGAIFTISLPIDGRQAAQSVVNTR